MNRLKIVLNVVGLNEKPPTFFLADEGIPVVFDLTGLILRAHAQPRNMCTE